MSHYGLLVLGPNPHEQLQPFQCYHGPEQLKYAQAVDVTDEVRKTYGEAEATFVQLPPDHALAQDQWSNWNHPIHGRVVMEHDSRLYRRNPNYDAKEGPWKPGNTEEIRVLPEGAREVEIRISEILSFKEFLEYFESEDYPCIGTDELGKCIVEGVSASYPNGYALHNDEAELLKIVQVTNQFGQWDWYEIGGRWKGGLKLKPNVTLSIGDGSAEILKLGSGQAMVCERGEKTEGADVAYKGDIDFEGMIAEGEAAAAERYDHFYSVVGHLPWPFSWPELHKHVKALKEPDSESKVPYKPIYTSKGLEVTTMDLARDYYHEQPAVIASKEDKKLREYAILECLFDVMGPDRAQYVRGCGLNAATAWTYSLIAHGEWASQGKMLMFGCSMDDCSSLEWAEKVWTLIQGLPDDTLVTVVDCHI